MHYPRLSSPRATAGTSPEGGRQLVTKTMMLQLRELLFSGWTASVSISYHPCGLISGLASLQTRDGSAGEALCVIASQPARVAARPPQGGLLRSHLDEITWQPLL